LNSISSLIEIISLISYCPEEDIVPPFEPAPPAPAAFPLPIAVVPPPVFVPEVFVPVQPFEEYGPPPEKPHEEYGVPSTTTTTTTTSAPYPAPVETTDGPYLPPIESTTQAVIDEVTGSNSEGEAGIISSGVISGYVEEHKVVKEQHHVKKEKPQHKIISIPIPAKWTKPKVFKLWKPKIVFTKKTIKLPSLLAKFAH
jgi:hypothetical protein